MKGTGTHCCLVSNQLIPNIIPLLDLKTRPRHVELLVSEDMQSASRQMTRLCRELGITVRQQSISAWDIDNIHDVIRELLARHENAPISLNATCGTKLMTLGAYNAFYAAGREIFYIDTRNDRRITLFPTLAQEAQSNVLTIRSCLTACGYSLGAHSKGYVNREERSLAELLVNDVKSRGKAICSLNWYAQEALADLRAEMASAHLHNMDFLELLQQFKAAGFLNWDSQRGVLDFPNEDSRFYVNGGWLEQHVLSVLNSLRPAVDIGDLAANALVQTAGTLANEVDVMFTARNRLFLVECKTRNSDAGSLAAGESINKLKTLTDALGGVCGKAMFVSYLPLKRTHCNRCKQYGIDLVHGAEIDKLHARLKRWVLSA